MPTPIIAGEKTAFIALVNVVSATEAAWITTNTINYEDIPTAIDRQDAFLAIPNYLDTCMAVFTNASLVAAKIYNGKTDAGGYTNPIMLNNTTQSAGIVISTSFTTSKLRILGTSVVNEIKTSGANNGLNTLTIGPGAIVSKVETLLDVTDQISIINIRCLRETGGTLSTITQGSKIGNINKDYCATFGGFGVTISTGSPCALPVTNLITSAISNSSIGISWVNTAGWFLNTIYIRRTGTTTWTQAFDSLQDPVPALGGGLYYSNDAFTFINLLPSTQYDIQVITTCTSGVMSTPTQLLAVVTSS